MSMDAFLKLKTKIQFVCYLQSWVLSHSSVILRILSLHFGEVDDEHVESHNLKKNLQKFTVTIQNWNIYEIFTVTIQLPDYSGIRVMDMCLIVKRSALDLQIKPNLWMLNVNWCKGSVFKSCQ